jgi:hypothetical protein
MKMPPAPVARGAERGILDGVRNALGGRFPFPHVSVYFGEASKPWQVAGAAAPKATDA